MSDQENIRTIEVSGVKFEVDMRTARKVESYKVGDRVKVLTKDYSGYKASVGCIVGIDAFKNLPTIVVAYVPNASIFSTEGKVEFVYLNAKTEDVEICPMAEDDIVPTRETIVTYFNRAIEKLRRDIADIEARKEYFLRQYGVAFGVGAAEVAAATE